ncbi:MAG: hypothetical protein E7652_02025 [Ruminococcaceae bacterium]|nr:hypothetical protein [Oscillospiraceae bacterium]
MKKTRVFSVLFIIILLCTSLSVYAEYNLDDYQYDENARYSDMVNASARKASPTLDANITDAEGWGTTVTYDYTNMPPFWGPSSRCITSKAVRYAWDDTGIYIAADITDPSMIASTGEDMLNDEGINEYGWNGDTFIFAIDPLNALFYDGFTSNIDKSVHYCISIDSTDKFICYAAYSEYLNGDITSTVKGAAKLTDKGWKFECMIPWDRILSDTQAASYDTVRLSKDDITLPGLISNVGIMYMDRSVAGGEFDVFGTFGAETGDIFTLSRSICVPKVHADGMDSMTGGDGIRSYGTKLVLADSEGNSPEVEQPVFDWTVSDEDVETTEEESAAVTTDAVAETVPSLVRPDTDKDDREEKDESEDDKTVKKMRTRRDRDDEDDEDEYESDNEISPATVVIVALSCGLVIGIGIAVIVFKRHKR